MILWGALLGKYLHDEAVSEIIKVIEVEEKLHCGNDVTSGTTVA